MIFPLLSGQFPVTDFFSAARCLKFGLPINPNVCLVLRPIFLESTNPRVLKTESMELADFHPSEILDKKQFLEA